MQDLDWFTLNSQYLQGKSLDKSISRYSEALNKINTSDHYTHLKCSAGQSKSLSTERDYYKFAIHRSFQEQYQSLKPCAVQFSRDCIFQGQIWLPSCKYTITIYGFLLKCIIIILYIKQEFSLTPIQFYVLQESSPILKAKLISDQQC